ncbi:Metal tolerance protein 4 [Glycine max]|nr:Metal tolerance protein 4 [Glycine max]
MQPVGITIFAAIMATLGFQVLVEAVQQLIKGKPTLKMTSDQLFWLYIIMLIATGVKLLPWLYCRSSGNKIADHYFDVITNIVGLVAAVLGDKFSWWIDPIGAILLALYTISNWSKTVLENVGSLFLSSYFVSYALFNYVDIELPEDLPLKEAHAIGESLQIRIEELPEVERAFVHLDTECEHKPEHSVLSTLPSSQI